MTEKINVISSDLDGAQLGREIHKNTYFTRCGGKEDNGQIQEAIYHMGKSQFSIPTDRWEAIFGGK